MPITVILNGGLGNQLFEYAAARALSLRRRTSVIVDLRDYVNVEEGSSRWSWITDLPIEAKVRTYPSQWFVKGFVPRAFHRIAFPLRYFEQGYLVDGIVFDPNVMNQPNGSVLFGVYQSFKYFSDVYDEFAHELDMSVLSAARLKITRLLSLDFQRQSEFTFDGATISIFPTWF